MLISEISWHLVKDRIPCEPQGDITCKGVHYPIRAYAPLLQSANAGQTATPAPFDVGTVPI